MLGKSPSPEVRKKISLTLKAKNLKSPMLGKKHTAETRAKMSLSGKGKNLGNKFGLGKTHTLSFEGRLKVSAVHKGKAVSSETREKIRASMLGDKRNLGKKASPEKLAKISKALKGKPWTSARREAQKKRLSTR